MLNVKLYNYLHIRQIMRKYIHDLRIRLNNGNNNVYLCKWMLKYEYFDVDHINLPLKLCIFKYSYKNLT